MGAWYGFFKYATARTIVIKGGRRPAVNANKILTTANPGEII